MDRLESVFVDEDSIIIETNGNFWQNSDSESKKLKIGEIFQLVDKTLSLSCIRCCETFQYFTEFSLHIQEHYLQGDIANLKKVSSENNVSLVEIEKAETISNVQNSSIQSIKNDESSNDCVNLSPVDFIDDSFGDFQNDSDIKDMSVHSGTASDHDSKENNQIIETKNENNNQSFGQLTTMEFVEGEHFIRDGRFKKCLTCDRRGIERWDHLKDHLYTHVAEKSVICPVSNCFKTFISFAYVRKHCAKVHKKKFSSAEIKEAQQMRGGAANVVKIKIKSNPNETNSMEQFTEKPHESHDKMPASMKLYKCEHCKSNKHFTQARYLQKHLRCVHALRVHIQSIIATQPTLSTDLVIHKPKINAERKASADDCFECFQCHTQVKTLRSLKKHLNIHSDKKYKCFMKGCHRLFAQQHYVMDHLVIVHGLKKTSALRAKIQTIPNPEYYYECERRNVSSYECYLCKSEYSSKLRMNRHFKNHLNGPFLCSHCGGTYKSADTLRHHMERHKANPDAPVQCPSCDKTYPTRRYMLRHFRIMHAANRVETKPKSDRPKKIGPTEMIDCEMDECDRKFSSTSRLKQHLVTHTKKLSFECPTCGWKCSIKSNLNQHMKVHSTEIKIPCTICNKLLSNRYLSEHMRIHSGLKSIQCDICGKNYFNSQRLKRHKIVVHTRERKFNCELCAKSFATSDKLLIHRRSHDEKMDFVCEVKTCQKGFYSINSLRKHSNAHYLEGYSIAGLKLENN